MEISSVNQARVFLWMIVCGAVCTFVFDVFRGIRRYKSLQNSVILLQDLVLWAIEIYIVYMVAFKLNYARVRAYEIVALVIGSLLYFVVLSDYVVKTVCRITAITEKCARRAVSPFQKLWKFVSAHVRRHIASLQERLCALCIVKRRIYASIASIRKNLFSKCPSEDEANINSQKNP